MSFGESIAPFLGRMILAWYFLIWAYRSVVGWSGMVSLYAIKGLPLTEVVLFIGIVAMVLGALALLISFHTRLGAMALFLVVVISATVLHNYWEINDIIQRQADFALFARDIAIAGGLLILVGMGPGRFALESAGGR
jgi:putative oxidoreductase